MENQEEFQMKFKNLDKDATKEQMIKLLNEFSKYLNNFESFCDEGYFEEELGEMMKAVKDEPEEDGYGIPYREPAIPGFSQPKVGYTYKTFDVKELERLRKNRKGIFIKI
jgi:hypothetical protein